MIRQFGKGYIEARITLGHVGLERNEHVKFIVVDTPTPYNAILGRPTLNDIGAWISTKHLVMMFLDRKNRVTWVYGDQFIARSCYNVTLHLDL